MNRIPQQIDADQGVRRCAALTVVHVFEPYHIPRRMRSAQERGRRPGAPGSVGIQFPTVLGCNAVPVSPSARLIAGNARHIRDRNGDHRGMRHRHDGVRAETGRLTALTSYPWLMHAIEQART
jgi:hypothetical protein